MSRAALSGASRNGIEYGLRAVIGVATNPGQIVTTATPVPLSSTRKLSREEITAALDAEYAPEPGIPRNPPTLATPTSAPFPIAISAAMNGWNVWTSPSPFVSTTALNAAVSPASELTVPPEIPALPRTQPGA